MSFDSRSTVPGLDVIIVASGPEANDGTPLVQKYVNGEQLLHVTLQEVAMTRGLQQVVMVADHSIDTMPGVKHAIEPTAAVDPVAAIACGVRSLWHDAAEYTALLCGWAPEAPQLLTELWEALADAPEADAAIAVDPDTDEPPSEVWGSVWRTTALWKVFEFLPEGNPDQQLILGGHTLAAIDGYGLHTTYPTEEALSHFGEVTSPDATA